jgi:hypothetical protein
MRGRRAEIPAVRPHEPDGHECRSAASSGASPPSASSSSGPTRSRFSKIPRGRSATSEPGARLDRTYADVRFGGVFEPVTASTPKQREVLLEQVKAHVTAELASRQRKRA